MPNLAGVVTSLTRLDTLHLDGVIDSIPDSFSSLILLRELAISGFDSNGPAFSISRAFAAHSPLQSLFLQDLSSASGQILPQICSTIYGLQSLHCLDIQADNPPDISAAACSFNPHLTELGLKCELSMLPPCVLPMTRLESLTFYAGGTTRYSVPPIGPYLHNLKSLYLLVAPGYVSIQFLLAARSLQYLSLFTDDDDDDGEVPIDDIVKILAHRPAACCVTINDQSWPPFETRCLQNG